MLPPFFVGAFRGLWLSDSASSLILALFFCFHRYASQVGAQAAEACVSDVRALRSKDLRSQGKSLGLHIPAQSGRRCYRKGGQNHQGEFEGTLGEDPISYRNNESAAAAETPTRGAHLSQRKEDLARMRPCP